MAQPPLLIQEGNSESRFVCMTSRTTKCKNWRRQCGHHCSQPPKKWPISRRGLKPATTFPGDWNGTFHREIGTEHFTGRLERSISQGDWNGALHMKIFSALIVAGIIAAG